MKRDAGTQWPCPTRTVGIGVLLLALVVSERASAQIGYPLRVRQPSHSPASQDRSQAPQASPEDAAGSVLEQQLVENLLREDLKLIEEAKAYSSLMNLNGWNGKQVAESLHVPPWNLSCEISKNH